jgi:hypothetical protein
LKKLFIIGLTTVLMGTFVGAASAKTPVHSSTKKSGTHVVAHNRSNTDGKSKNKLSTKGNTNPKTGKKGIKTHPTTNHKK